MFNYSYVFILLLILLVLIISYVWMFTTIGNATKYGRAEYDHTVQKEINKIKTMNKNVKEFSPISFSKIPTTFPYSEKNDPITEKNIHIGQRKLLMNEIYFLTRYGHLSSLVVYAGSAPGTHIPLLSKLFPMHDFELWDPAKFNSDLIEYAKTSGKIVIYNDYFTNSAAEKYTGKDILFISDIRSGVKGMNMIEFEERVNIDNNWMCDWMNIMKPSMAMLKFRLPFTTKGSYQYLDGDIDLQPWAPKHSSETRLITDGTKTRLYSLNEFDARMFYVNNFWRPYKKYKNVLGDGALNWDTAYEIYIWKLYFKNLCGNALKTAISEAMSHTNDITKRNLFGQYIKKTITPL